MTLNQYLLGFVLLIASNNFIRADDSSSENDSSSSSEENKNISTPQDLYVIKTIVYEVGILTDANDTDRPVNETHEQIDVSFFDPKHNGSVFDLSNIPIPIQTNVSGTSVTGILPSNLGTILIPKNGTAELNGSFPIIPNKQIKVTQNISTDNPQKGSAIISNLPQILGLNKILNRNNTEDKINATAIV